MSWFFLLYLILMIYILYVLITMVKNGEVFQGFDSNYHIMAMYFMTGFLFGYAALYTGSSATLRRGINAGLLMGLFYLIFAEGERWHKTIGSILIVWLLFSSVGIWNNLYKPWVDGRANIAQYTESILVETEKLDNLIQLSQSSDPWENTIARYGDSDYRCLAFPAGFGSNSMMQGDVNKNARCAVVMVGTANEDQYVKRLLDAGHMIISEDEYFIIFENILKYPR